MRRIYLSGVLATICCAVQVFAAATDAQSQPAERVRVARPFWKSSTMNGESVLFIKPDDGGPATASLLFGPKKIISIASSDGKSVYREGSDYRYTRGNRVLNLPAGSTIPAKTMKELTPPLNSQPFGLVRRDGKGDILFGATHEYADMQVVVTYEHSGTEWKGPAPRLAERELSETLRILRAGKPLKLVLFGDSISAGCNASKWANTPPFQPAYGELLADNLSRAYGSTVTFRNLSEGGRTSGWGVEHIDPLAGEKPDLLILAWGMNDSTGMDGGLPAEPFIANIKAQMAAVRQLQPKADFILVASMLSNREWQLANPDRLLQYRDAMCRLAAQGVAFADLSSVWEALLARKHYADLTGNGVNHPNDFGHRLYADVLSTLLIDFEGHSHEDGQ